MTDPTPIPGTQTTRRAVLRSVCGVGAGSILSLTGSATRPRWQNNSETDGGDEAPVDDSPDGATTNLSVELLNDRVAATFETEYHDSPIYLSAFRLEDDQRDLLGDSLRFQSVAPDGATLEHERTFDQRFRSYQDSEIYQIERRFAFDDQRVVRIVNGIQLFDPDPYVILHTGIRNTGDQPVIMDQPQDTPYRGWRPAAFLELADPVSPPQFHVAQTGTYSFADVESGETFPFGGETPFVTLFDEEHGIAYRQLEGDTPSDMVIIERDDAPSLSYTVRGPSLASGEETYYAGVLAGHIGGDRAIQTAQQAVRAAERLGRHQPTPD